jgi:hypothetical protein
MRLPFVAGRSLYEVGARDPSVVADPLCSCLRAKRRGAHVKGRVTDETGGALPGVTVELLGGSEPREVVTDGQDNYDFENVPAGTYQLSMRLINFAAVNHKDLKVGVGQIVTNDEVMHLSLNAEVVVVGKRTFTNLADVENPAEDLVGIASSASQGAITAKQLDVRPFMRQAEVLETVPRDHHAAQR